ncbi:hypothetical protein GLYMA_01G096900v4 [Glycine max]|uniref:DUF659 domain-containing protein n=1 Tax=Glycine max TaxID=3847 RepID=A0A0R0LHC6_SOYBN|nr:hypothetical protein JHK87_001127 [Glycine soja]KAG5068782.1 hypothetical protein JHK85_001159 [Glycine max]KAG5088517.1 hypothetical protein JHK86_001129 [Glycine max]KAH1162382.1 hypothetical protein GYH30_001043 [Glycine max]KRH75620.1 hypothetical protein GLYMA_01G096900v4 [Glycine max]
MCLYCDKIIKKGGINRLKAHLAGGKGQVEQCKKVLADIPIQLKQNNARKIIFVSQPTLKCVLQPKEVVQKCDIAFARWMIDAHVPFNVVNTTYYQPMVDAFCSIGPGYKGPNFHNVRCFLLNNCVNEVRKVIEKYHHIWKQIGCTIIFVDPSNASKTTENLYKILRDVVLRVGLENVVHVVTDNAANYVVVGKLLEVEFPNLYCSPCVAHCINLMLLDIGKIDEVSEVVSLASKITRYIYNHCYALYLMRKHTDGREILCPTLTCFANNIIDLQRISAKKDSLRAMKLKLTEPLVLVLRLVDSEDKLTMGFLYHAMHKAREEMVRRFQRNKKKVEPYLTILDRFTTLYPKSNSHLTSEFRLYKNIEGDFGRQSIVRERNIVMPGLCAPHLQKMAIYILSQTCSWSIKSSMILSMFVKKHANWVLEESPPFLTNEKINVLDNDLANITI